MRVVADTGPLHYLVLIDAIEILPRLLGGLAIPQAVRAELDQPRTPIPVRHWIATPPAWLKVRPTPVQADPRLAALDEGERPAIALAARLAAELLLMDERAGVAAARARGGLLDLAAAFAALRATNFHARPEMLERLLAEHRPRQGPS